MESRRLLLISSKFWPKIGGGETYVIELIRHFSHSGWDVHLITNSTKDSPLNWPGCNIHYIDGLSKTDLRPAQSIPEIHRLLEVVRPTVVHVQSLTAFFLYSSVVAKGQFPTVLTIHSTPDIPNRLLGLFDDFDAEAAFSAQLLLSEKYDRLLLGSHYYLNAYKEVAPCVEYRAEVLHYFPSNMKLLPRSASHERRVGSFNILFPSRIIERKGIEDCLEALASLPETFRLSLPALSGASETSYTAKIKQRIKKLGIQNRIDAGGDIVTPEKMVDWYDRADCVVIPSHYEGFGIVAVEAMARRVPIITTAVGGLSEIVKDNSNGLVVPMRQPVALAEAVERIRQDSALRMRLVEAGGETVRMNFSRDKHMKHLEEIYERITRQ